MNILYIVLYIYRMTEHTKCSIGVHYELDKGIESEKKIVCIVLHGLSLIRNWPLKCRKQNFRKLESILKRVYCVELFAWKFFIIL